MRRLFEWLDREEVFTSFILAVAATGLLLLIDWALRSIPRGRDE